MRGHVASRDHDEYTKEIDVYAYKDNNEGKSEVEVPMIHIMDSAAENTLELHPEQALELITLIKRGLDYIEAKDYDHMGEVK